MEKLITLVVCAYNEEKNIKRLVESFLMQEEKQYDIVFVNDGSTDSTKDEIEKYIEEFEKNDIKLKIYTISNSGLSEARNFGASKVETKYLTFIDADDTLDKKYIKILNKNIKENSDIDLIKFNETFIYKDGEKENETIEVAEGTGLEIFEKICFKDKVFMQGSMWCIKLSFWRENNFSFTPNIYHEDLDFIPKMMLKAKKIKVLDTSLYNYIQNERKYNDNNRS